LILKLYDAWSEEVLWEETFSNGSRGEIISEEEVAILSDSGELIVLSLTEGTERFRQQLRPIRNLAHLHVQPSQDRYLVLAGQTTSAPQSISLVAPNLCSPILDGQLYALEPNTGEMLWPRPAEIEQFAVPLLQPAEAPVFVMLRNITYRMNQNRQVGSMLCIDKRDGRLLHTDDELSRPTAAYQIVAEPRAKNMQITLGAQVVTHALRLTFTDEPTPPAPPAQTGDASSLPNPFTANRIRQWAGMLVSAFEQGEFPATWWRAIEPSEFSPFHDDPFDNP
jgi:hypothetical protein